MVMFSREKGDQKVNTALRATSKKKLRVILIDRLGELVGAGGALHAAGVAS